MKRQQLHPVKHWKKNLDSAALTHERNDPRVPTGATRVVCVTGIISVHVEYQLNWLS